MAITKTLRMLTVLVAVLLAGIAGYGYLERSEIGKPASGRPAVTPDAAGAAEAQPDADKPAEDGGGGEPAERPAAGVTEPTEPGNAVEVTAPEGGVSYESAEARTDAAAPDAPAGAGTEDEAPSRQAAIEAEAEGRLVALRNGCKSRLMGLGLSYLSAESEEERIKLMAGGKAEVASCASQFEAIVSETERKLEEGGFPTDVIASYREAFEAEIAAGLAMAGDMR